MYALKKLIVSNKSLQIESLYLFIVQRRFYRVLLLELIYLTLRTQLSHLLWNFFVCCHDLAEN